MDTIKQFLRKPGAATPSTGTKNNNSSNTEDGFKSFVKLPPPRPPFSERPPRILIIGAGSRGNTYAAAIVQASNGIVGAVAEPVLRKRRQLGRRYIWGTEEPQEGEEFLDYTQFVRWETERRAKAARGEDVPEGIDAALVCTLDGTHVQVMEALAPLNLHVLCEKPLASSLHDCLDIYRSVKSQNAPTLFAIGHILRYAPRNTLLRKLLLEDEAIGEIVSLVHTEPVGYWHFAHSYVRGNWRNESTSGPTLLTKGCHDMDFLLWLLCSPHPKTSQQKPHLPSSVNSTGSLVCFKKSRKPAKAGNATNCVSCPIEAECQYSARKIYYDIGVLNGLGGWPVNIVLPDIEDYFDDGGLKKAEEKLMEVLSEDYDVATAKKETIESRPWYGRCVYESDNNVCDDQTVTITWEDDPITYVATSEREEQDAQPNELSLKGRGAKTATFRMTAFTDTIGARQTHIYGTHGEIEASERTITVRDFRTGQTETHKPHISGGGHGGGDHGLIRQFVLAVDAVKNHGMSVEEAQRVHLGCTPEDIVRSHAMVFAAEEARKEKKVVDWGRWWDESVRTYAPGIEY